MKKQIIFIIACLISCLLVGCDGRANSKGESETGASELETDTVETQTDSEIESSETELIKMEDLTFEYAADLTHDGTEDTVRVMLRADEEGYTQIGVYVFSGEKSIFQDELELHYALGGQYYFVSYEDKAYLMYYNTLVDHDMATCSYEIFSLSAEGEKVVLDTNNMEQSFYAVDSMDKKAWVQYAEQVNKYFENAFLLVSTQNAELEYSDTDNKKTYVEQYDWLLSGDVSKYETVEEILDAFVVEVKELYK